MDLISLIKAGKEKDAVLQVDKDHESDSTALEEYNDEHGNTVLHHACEAGMINVVVHMLEGNRKILNTINQKGQTAVHKAVNKSKVEILVALASFDADLNVMDSDDISPLDIALKNKNLDMIKLLCEFGATPIEKDFIVSSLGISSFSSEDQKLMEPILKQQERLAAVKYESIDYYLQYIKSEDNTQYFSGLGITTKENKWKENYFLYISKEAPEIWDVESNLKPDEALFSDIYVVKSWGPKPDTIAIDINIEDRPRINETLQLVALQGKVLTEEDLTNNVRSKSSKEMTTAFVQVNLKSTAVFAVTVMESSEVYNVGTAAQQIQPKMEPGSKINFPAGTFGKNGKISINVLESQIWNQEEDSEQDVLFSNILEISLADKSQPKQPVTVTMPLHSTVPADDEIVILMSKGEQANDEDEWDVTDIKEREGNYVTFVMNHFSIYTAASKKKTKKARSALTNASKRLRKFHCFVMMRPHQKTKLSLVVECSTTDRSEERRQYWIRKGFVVQKIPYKAARLKERSTYIIKLTGNVAMDNLIDDVHSRITLKSNLKDNIYRTFHLKNEADSTIEGNICLGRFTQQKSRNKTNATRSQGFFDKIRGVFVSDKEIQSNKEFTEFVTLPLDQSVTVKRREIKLDPNDINCTIPVLWWKSLSRLSNKLSTEECLELAKVLKVGEKKFTNTKKSSNIRDEWYRLWRPSRPNEHLVKTLEKALRIINKHSEADKVLEAFDAQLEYL